MSVLSFLQKLVRDEISLISMVPYEIKAWSLIQ